MTLYQEGDGDGALALVCLHGWGLNLRVFDGLRAALARPVVAIDLPGHGASPWDASRGSFEQQAEQLLEALPARSVLLGWSLGGQFALELARRAPSRIAALVLVATTPRFVAGPDWPYGMAPSVMQRFAAQLTGAWRQTVAEFLQLQVRGSRDAPYALERLELALQAHGEAQPEALVAGLDILARNDLRATVATLALPALIVSGQHDRITAPGAGAWLAQQLEAGFCELPRAGHAPFLSHAPAFCDELEQFLAAEVTSDAA